MSFLYILNDSIQIEKYLPLLDVDGGGERLPLPGLQMS